MQSINFSPSKIANVIVGPNATGKSTLLEAIRLVKGLLAPRYPQETQQILVSMGAISPNFAVVGGQIDYAAIANDITKPLNIKLDIEISETELAHLRNQRQQLGFAEIRSRRGGLDQQSQFAFTQYLSSADGQKELRSAEERAATFLDELSKSRSLDLSLDIDPASGLASGRNPFAQLAITALEARLSPQRTLFSYFPADRAFPPGEVNIQIGSADTGNQIQSHLGQAATKYQRLKQIIVQGVLFGNTDRGTIPEEFSSILTALLPGKTFSSISANQLGLLKVNIKDGESNKIFDIDLLSSGEKGLILTFLLIWHSVSDGGVLLIDEPELHLNPAVCRNLLPHLIEHIGIPYGIQIILCTHSPEILGVAFEREDTNLFHLRSGADLTPVLRRDQAEVFEILRRLGASTADVLFSRGSIFVEGDHDAEILSEGFGNLVGGFKITDLGGRQEVEKEIQRLQQAEEISSLNRLYLFLFDRDNEVSHLRSTKMVRVHQWDRYCLENYLLDSDLIFDLLTLLAKHKPESRGSFATTLKELALSQLTEVVAREVYRKKEPENPGFRPSETTGRTYTEIGTVIGNRLVEIGKQITALDTTKFASIFARECAAQESAIRDTWQRDWMKLADGKRVIKGLYRNFEISMPQLEFKKRVIRQMQNDKTEAWRALESDIRAGLQS